MSHHGGGGGGGWHRSVTGFVRRTFEAAVEDNIPFLASALSFDLLLTAIPFFALLLALIGYLAQSELTAQQIDLHQLLERFLPPHARVRGADAFAQVERVVEELVAWRGKLALIGVPLFLWFSTRLFGSLRVALNEVFDTDENRPWPVAALTDLVMVLVTGSLFVANALLSAGVSYLEARSVATLGRSVVLDGFWQLCLQLVALSFGTGLFFLIFKFMPSRRIHWRTALVASLFCALAFEIAKGLYAWYLTNFATLDRVVSDANVAAFFLFLLWVYYSAYVFLLGGEVAETYDLVRLRRAQRVVLG